MNALAVNPEKLAAFTAAVFCGLLLLQYAHRRSPVILVWSAGWLLIAPAMLLGAGEYSRPAFATAATAASQLLNLGAAALFLWSGDIFRHTRLVQLAHLKPLVVIPLWFLIAPALFGPGAVKVPGYIAIAFVLAGAGSLYAAVLLERRMIGAGLLAFVLFGLGISSLTAAFVQEPVIGAGPFAMEILTVNAVLYACGALGMHLLVFEDMTSELRTANRRLEAAREELLQAAITDPLTGCHNRRFLEQITDRELQRHARFALPMSLLFIDVDHFKAVNDQMGHEAGDKVLQYVTRFLKRHIREADYVFRYGGDEFLVLITCRGEEARKKSARLKKAFVEAPEASEMPDGVALSVGWMEVPAGATDLAPFLREVDQRMYADKRHGSAGL